MEKRRYEGLSVIIPVYNSEKCLQRCLNSVIEQKYKDIEIICINDGSTDSSAEILDHYSKADSRVKVVHKQNEGVSVARNLGIKTATKPLITFVDSDDYIEPDMFLKMMERMQQDELDCVCCNARRILNKNRVLPIVSGFGTSVLRGEEIREEAIKALIGIIDRDAECLCFLWNKIYVLEILNKHNIRLNEKRNHGEDWLFNIDYLSHIDSIGFMEEMFYNYWYTTGSLVSRPRKEYFEWCIQANDLFMQKFPDFDREFFIRKSNRIPIMSALYYRHTFKGEERKAMLAKIYTYCKETDYYKNSSFLTDQQIKLKRCLDEGNKKKFISYLKKFTNKGYYKVKIRETIKKIVRSVTKI